MKKKEKIKNILTILILFFSIMILIYVMFCIPQVKSVIETDISEEIEFEQEL